MNCDACGEENRPGAKFCAECGTPFAKLCTNCNSELRSGAKFCDECGTTTAAGSAKPPPVDTAVRKIVTVLFADLVGSTAFAEQVDTESARTSMGRYHEMAQRVIERHGGTLEKFIGDGVMAVFGIPEVAEDDALRSVRAGLDLQAEFQSIASSILGQHDIDLGLRVGINTGEIVIADEDADLIGDALNTAARLEAECAPGSVLVGEDTWRLTRSSVSYEVLAEVSVKGKAEPVATFRVLSADEDDMQTPFVGREDELDQLTVGFDAATNDGAARLITVIGSPGVGKTRLAAELRERTSDYAQAFDLRVDRAGTGTFAPVAELLRTSVGLEDGLDPQTTIDRLAAFVGTDVADAERLVDLLASLASAAAPRSTEETFWATRRLLEILAGRRQVILVIDDIQWAEPLFLDLLEHLVEWVDAPVLLVGLARPELRDIRPALCEPGRRVSDVISIEGLDAAATEALAARLLDTEELPRELAELLPETTQGNPLFVREVVRMLVDDNVITQTDAGWRLAIDREAVEVPPTIQSLLATRVERMPADERQFMEMASVVGSEFARGAVESLIPTLSKGEMDNLLERLRRKELIDPTGSYWGDEPLLRFHHVLIRDAAYRRLLKERRAELHLAVAEWTETTASQLAGDHEISIAYHYEQAHDYRSQLGILDDATVALGEKAANLLRVAAERALDQDDLSAAGSLAQRALALSATDAADRPELLLLACEAFLSASNVNAADPILVELIDVAKNDARLSAWADAFEGEMAVRRTPDQLVATDAVVQAAAETLALLDDQAGVAKARLVRAMVLSRLGRVGEAETELDHALTAARSADDRRRISTVLGAAPLAALWGPSPVARAGGRCLDIIRLLRITSASPMVEAASIRCQGVLEAMRARYDQARELMPRSGQIVEELGHRHGVLETQMFTGIVESYAGDPVAAEVHLQSAYAGFQELGARSDAGRAASLLARVVLDQGRVDEAEQLASDSDALAGQALQTAIASRCVMAEIAAQRGRHGEALRLAEEAVAIAETTDLTIDHADAAASLSQVLGLSGDDQGALLAADIAAALYESKGVVVAARTSAPEAGEISLPQSELDSGVDETPNVALENGATRWLTEWQSSASVGADTDALVGMLAAGGTWIDGTDPARDAVTEELGDSWLDERLRNGDVPMWPLEPLAIRGERFCLAREGTLSTSGGLCLFELDAEHRLLAGEMFASGDLHKALAELDDRYLLALGAEYVPLRVSVRQIASWREDPGATGIGIPTAENFKIVDHRPLGHEEHDGEEFEEAITVAWPVGSVIIPAERVRVHPSGMLTRHIASHEADGFKSDNYAIQIIAAGVLARLEVFPADARDVAIARFEELSRNDKKDLTRLRDNFATRWIAESFKGTLIRDHDISGYIATIAPNATWDLQSSYGDVVMGINQMEEWTRAFIEDTPDGMMVETLAVRGDRLCLCRAAGIRDSTFGSGDRWIVVDVDEDGKLRAGYDVVSATVADGINELTRRYVEGEGAEFAELFDLVAALAQSVELNEIETNDSLLSQDFISVDHRPFTEGPLDRVGFQAQLAAHIAVTGSNSVYLSDVIRIAKGGLLGIVRITAENVDEFTSEWVAIMLLFTDNGRVVRMEQFAADQLDEALARFDELINETKAKRSLTFAERRTYEAMDAVNRGDIEGFAAGISPDLSGVSHRSIATGAEPYTKDLWVSNATVLAGFGPALWQRTSLAVRGDRLVLTRTTASSGDGFMSEYLLLMQYDDEGLLSRIDTFDADDLDAAKVVLNDWYSDTTTALRAAREFGRFLLEGNFESVAGLISADFHLESARRLGVPSLDKTALIDSFVAQHELYKGAVSITPISTRGDLIVLSTLCWGDVDDFDHRLLVATDFDDGGVIRRGYSFDEDQLAEAEALLDEWYAESHASAPAMSRPNAVGRPKIAEVLDNVATRTASHGWSQLLGERDPSSAFEIYHPDAILDDRRAIVGWNQTMPEVQASFDTLAQNGDRDAVRDWSMTPVAIRGENLALISVRSIEPSDSFEFTALELLQVDAEGVVVRDILFDVGAIESAVEEMDRLYIETDGAEFEEIIELVLAGHRVIATRDPEMLLSIAHSDYESADHRNMGWPGSDVASSITVLDAMKHDGSGAHIYATRFHRLSRNAVVFASVAHDLAERADRFEWHQLTVITSEDAKLRTVDFYEESDLDSALARFDELTSPQDSSADMGTHAMRLTHAQAAMRSAFEAESIEGLKAALAPGFLTYDERPNVNAVYDRDQSIENIRMILDGDLGPLRRMSYESIATRGENLVLVCARFFDPDDGASSFEVSMLVVMSVSDDGALLSATNYDVDQIDLAYDKLDQSARDALGSEALATFDVVYRFGGAHLSGDVTAAEVLLADDFVLVDHRPTSFGQLDRNGMLEFIPSLTELAPDVMGRGTSMPVMCPAGVVAEMSLDDPGGANAWSGIGLWLVRGGQVSRIEYFEPEAMEHALARFEELTSSDGGDQDDLEGTDSAADRGPDPIVDDASGPTASELIMRLEMTLTRRDFDAYRDLLSAEFVHHDHRVGSGTHHDRDAAVDAERTAAEVFGHRNPSQIVAVVEPFHVMTTGNYGSAGSTVMAFVEVTEFDAGGLAVRSETFDPDRADDAEKLFTSLTQ